MSNDSFSKQPLALVFDGESAELRSLGRAAVAYEDFLREVSASVYGDQRVDWSVRVEAGSVCLPVQPQLPESDAEAIVDTISGGLERLGSGSSRPEHFSDRALTQLGEITKFSRPESPIYVATHSRRVAFDESLTQRIERILEPVAQIEIGSVEGIVEEINAHGDNSFQVWDATSNKRVICEAGTRVSDEELRDAFKKRVHVRGQILSDGPGRTKRVKVRSMRILRSDDKLPTLDDVRGIFKSA